MILGAHVSVAGGLHNGPRNGKSLGCESIQIFTRNQRQWKVKLLETNEIESFTFLDYHPWRNSQQKKFFRPF